MAITLGFQPEKLVVKLSRFGDLITGLSYDLPNEPEAGWPEDAVIALRFYATEDSEEVGAEHEAAFVEVDGVERKVALWTIPKAQTRSLIVAGLETARLFYSVPGRELEWAVGGTKDVR